MLKHSEHIKIVNSPDKPTVAIIPSGGRSNSRGGCKLRQLKYTSDGGLRVRISRPEGRRPIVARLYMDTLGSVPIY